MIIAYEPGQWETAYNQSLPLILNIFPRPSNNSKEMEYDKTIHRVSQHFAVFFTAGTCCLSGTVESTRRAARHFSSSCAAAGRLLQPGTAAFEMIQSFYRHSSLCRRAESVVSS